MTTNRSNYRVRLDLSKYHQDARRFSWIYVDAANVCFVTHVKQHITEIFGTREPFHLLLNGKEYLPPIEDARVIKENELISVVPGTGISDNNDVTISMPLPEKQETIAKHAEREEIATNGDCEEEKSKMLMETEPNDSKSLNNLLVDISAIDATMYHSMREVTEMETTQDSKATDDNVTDNCSTTDVHSERGQKRKRVRRKRSKIAAETTLPERVDQRVASSYQSTVYKPKTPSIVPTGKHIHFDAAEDATVKSVENGANDLTAENKKSKPGVASPTPTTTKNSRMVGSLSTLLALRQCSTPLMFVNKKAKHASDRELEVVGKNNVEVESRDIAKDESTIRDTGFGKRESRDIAKDESTIRDTGFGKRESRDIAKDEPTIRDTGYGKRESSDIAKDTIRETGSNGDHSVVAKTTEEPSDYENIDPGKYPSLQFTTEINDIIIFKILRITNDYTPEVSDYIVAKTINWCPKKMLFTFQILKGHMDIQTPQGKFSLPEDESQDQIRETADLNFSQLIDPRLIYRK